MLRTFAFAAVLALAAGGASPSSPGGCPEGHPMTGDLGIGGFECVGGSCTVNERRAGGYAHDFSTEPRVRRIDPKGPSAGKLRDGDVLTAIDGALVTTPEAGRRLANLAPGRPVALTVRRDGRESRVTVVPRPGCNMPDLSVTVAPGRPSGQAQGQRPDPPRWEPPRPREDPDAPRPDAWLGVGLRCGDCGWEAGEDGAPVWRTRIWPEVRSVQKGGPADRAGLRTGDVLTHIDGVSIASREGGRRLGSLRPGQRVEIRYGRGASSQRIWITAERSPESEI